MLGAIVGRVIGWFARLNDPVVEIGAQHWNGWGFECDGRLPDGDACESCLDCGHPTCRHDRQNATCLDCTEEDGVCRS